MASSSDVVKRVTRFKLQLADTAESATVHAHGGGGGSGGGSGGSCSLRETVLRILQKLKDMNITLEVLSETGIGKIVNSWRRHEKAGELAKSLVRGWKKLLSKEGTSLTDDASEAVSVKDKLDDQKCPDAGALKTDLNNNNCETSHSKSQDSSDEAFVKTGSKKEKQRCGEQKGKKKENPTKTEQVKEHIFQSDVLEKKTESDEIDDSFPSKKNDQRDRKSRDGNKNPKEAHLRSRSDSREKLRINSDSGRFVSEKEPNKKLKKKSQESFSFETSDKYSKTLKLTNVGDDESSGISRSSESRKRKRKKTSKERSPALNHEQESEDKGCSKNKKAKMKPKDEGGGVDRTEASKSFESFLNYDMNMSKKKERCGAKKTSKKLKIKVKEEATKHPDVKPFKLSANGSPLKQRFQDSVMELMSIRLPASLPECEKPSCVDYVDMRVEKESDICEVSEEPAMFTGQRLNKKMQVYSGAKTVFLPAMLSLYQQCIRTLQNNIGMLHETGGVPFEILEPVLERCTSEQLLRIEECNPIYVGVTDHLWGKHCQRDFKHSSLQEYESWKEMYVRLSEERERKLHRLTKTIISAHSVKPKGRQVKMAFIHTVAKPPRDVRIQQEIHGTASQQPNPPRSSVKVEDNRLRPSYNEPSKTNSSSSGGSTTQDPRKKTRVAPMMAKSLKAFKKQLGRR